MLQLKADRPHPRDNLQTLTDYLRLVMVADGQTDRRTDATKRIQTLERTQTDRHYQVHYLPASLSYTVDKYYN